VNAAAAVALAPVPQRPEAYSWDLDATTVDLEASVLKFFAKPTRFEGMSWRQDWSGLRVVIYARISHDPKWLNLGTKRQARMCRERAESRGATVVGVYIDDGISASPYSTKPRPGFNALMDVALAGRADIILVVDADRLYRRLTEFAPVLEMFQARAAQFAVVALRGDFELATSTGRFHAGLKVLMAQQESENISRRVTDRNQATVAQGQPLGVGRRAFGWEQDGRTPRPDEVALLAEAWQAVLADASIQSIAADWERRGVPSAYPVDRTGAVRPLPPWSRRGATVKKILTNPRHVGDLVYRGQVLARNRWPGIIDRETWEKVLGKIEGRSMRANGAIPGPRRRHEFTGLFACGRGCGRLHRAKASGRVVWRCPSCNLSAMAVHIEAPAREAALDIVESPAFYQLVAAGLAEDKTVGRQLADEIDRKDKRILKLHARWRAEAIEDDDYEFQLAHLKAERRELSNQVRRQAHDQGVLDWLDDVTTLRAQWNTLDADGDSLLALDLRRNVLFTVYESIVIHPRGRKGRGFDPTRVEPRFTAPARGAS
jgi:site-specific DNA recombinase